MNNIFEIFKSDPIMLAAALVLIGTIAILAWALKALNGATTPQNEDATYEDIAIHENQQQQHDENTGLTEARLQAIVNQLNDIGQRLSDIEKIIKNTSKASDQTVPMLLTPQKLDENFKRLEARIEALASERPQGAGGQSPDTSALEAKLEGIHKLLIYLTDSSK